MRELRNKIGHSTKKNKNKKSDGLNNNKIFYFIFAYGFRLFSAPSIGQAWSRTQCVHGRVGHREAFVGPLLVGFAGSGVLQGPPGRQGGVRLSLVITGSLQDGVNYLPSPTLGGVAFPHPFVSLQAAPCADLGVGGGRLAPRGPFSPGK